MLNWSIDIEAKEPLHQGFVHVITLSNGTNAYTQPTGKESTCSWEKWGS